MEIWTGDGERNSHAVDGRGFTVDSRNAWNVRFFVLATGTYQHALGGATGMAAAWMTPPDGREYRGSTEAWSLLFAEDRESRELRVRGISAGYVEDWFEDGNSASTGADETLPPTTGGLSFGILNTPLGV
uniref:Uncharacterized protein n=1 Tax=Proboscia inermis TaxID=420281 RepID=A0A7S0GFZ0_9STRA|mmetsp:Transcript_32548/g.32856  ORF Transcript_32548/g.32856 Transcript_32548/m.32856 type:complete len:130 (+) Transcript_32548:44-433(+)